MNTKEAIKICEENGWNVRKGKYILDDEVNRDICIFKSDKDLIKYAKEIKNER